MKKKLGIFFLIVLLFLSPSRVNAATAGDISKELICQCGCETVLSECDCDIMEEMTVLIEQKLAEGLSEEQIIQSFVDQYGEQVLTSPQKEDSNPIAWIAIIAALLLAGGIAYIALMKRTKRMKARRQ